MRVAYVVSMFPCWSETFILNELVSHREAGLDLDVFSLKRCHERMVHREAQTFVGDTCYPPGPVRLLWLHLLLLASSPLAYCGVLWRLLRLLGSDRLVLLKAWAVFALAPAFVREAKRRRVEHLHAHFATYPALLAWMVGRFTGRPFTFTAHAHDIYVNQDLLPTLCEACAGIVTISDFNRRFIADRVGARYLEKISVIRCGIPLERLGYRGPSAFLPGRPAQLVSVGRLSGIKGYRFLIEALRLLGEDGVDFACSIVGDGPLRAALERQVEQAGLCGRVSFLGSRTADQIPELLSRADLFVLACATDPVEGHDGIPVVFMEAMALGVPVLGTRISGIPELLRDGRTGYCAEPEDPYSLKREIARALSEPERLPGLTLAARRLVEEDFSIEKNSRRLRLLFSRSAGLPAAAADPCDAAGKQCVCSSPAAPVSSAPISAKGS